MKVVSFKITWSQSKWIFCSPADADATELNINIPAAKYSRPPVGPTIICIEVFLQIDPKKKVQNLSNLFLPQNTVDLIW